MTQVLMTNTVVADFDGVRLEYNGERFVLGHRGNQYWVDVAEILPNGSLGESSRFPMELVTGSHHMQVFWLPAGAGNAQIGFPFTWLIDDRRWVPRESTFIRDPEAPQQIETWNMTCIRCHTTGGQPRPRREQGVFDTRVADLGIACEACHGPALDHVAYRRARAEVGTAAATGAKPSHATTARTNAAASSAAAHDPIVQPARLDPTRASHVCAQCHSMKWYDSSEGWVENGFRYRPGDDLEATTPVMRFGRQAEQPWMKRVLEKSPNLLNEFFWPDGMIRVAGREFNGLLETACFQKGQLSCLSCHALHKYADRDDQLKPGMEGNRACVQCHQEPRYGPGHTHHAADSSGSVCYNCHMPHTTYALLGGIRQHKIDSPTVAATLTTGRLNACNICHADRSLAWAGDHLTAWYRQPKAQLDSDSRDLSAVAHALLTGDAGQRALAAWYLGWEPGRRVAGDHWQAPLLARTLADPYAAVRRIALASLRRLPGFADLDFNFATPTPPQLDAAASEVRRWWRPVEPGGMDPSRMRAVLLTEGGDSDPAAVRRWLDRRNDRPMRLRE